MTKGAALREKAIAAMKDVAVRVVEEHRLAGLPVVIWKDGKVVREYSKEPPVGKRRPVRHGGE